MRSDRSALLWPLCAGALVASVALARPAAAARCEQQERLQRLLREREDENRVARLSASCELEELGQQTVPALLQRAGQGSGAARLGAL